MLSTPTRLLCVCLLAASPISLTGCLELDADPLDDSTSEDLRAGKIALVDAIRAQVALHGIEPLPPPPPVSPELFELGRSLAFDKVLSGNANISCLTCHHPVLGSDDDRALSRGEGGSGLGLLRTDGEIIPRNAPMLFNLHTHTNMFWDGRVEPDGEGGTRTPAGAQLSEQMVATFDFGVVSAQAMFPVTSREEMRGQPGDNEIAALANDDFTGIWAALMVRLGEIPVYVDMFEAAYPGEDFEDMSFAHAANALAGFEIIGFDRRDSPWSRFLDGDDKALSVKELRGAELFFELDCVGCHSGSAFSDFEFHNIGLAQFGPGKGDGPSDSDDFGREQVTGDASDRYAFRTPPLANAELTGPYGHAGQFATLEQHIAQYVDPAGARTDYDITESVSEFESELWEMLLDNEDEVIAALSPFAELAFAAKANKQRKQVKALAAFVRALTDDGGPDLVDLVPDSVPSGLPVED